MYIFLDIDGVLNTEQDWRKLYQLRKSNINKLCADYPNARIILISSWRSGFVSRNNSNNSAPIKELESCLSNGVQIIGKTEVNKKYRNEQILDYIKTHPSIGDDYVIIDDDANEYNKEFLKNKHLQIVNSKTGY